MKNIISILILWMTAFTVGNGQVFEVLTNNSGFNFSISEKDTLEFYSNKILDILPDTLRFKSFKSYYSDMYYHNKDMNLEVNTIIESYLNQIENTTNFYISVFRINYTDSSVKFKVHIEVPNELFFSCYSLNYFKAIEARFENNLNNNGYLYYKEVLKSFTEEIVKMKNCCDPINRTDCNTCISPSNIEFLLENKKFQKNETEILQAGGFPLVDNNYLVGESGWKVDIDGLKNKSLEEKMSTFNSICVSKNLSFKGFITSDFSTCDETFSLIDSLYSYTDVDVKVWWHISENNDVDKIFELADIEKLKEIIGLNILNLFVEEVDTGFECKGTNRFVPPTRLTEGDWDAGITTKEEGMAAHFIIQTFYGYLHQMDLLDGKVLFEYQIPESSPSGNMGYADIVNYRSKEIFEIKTVRSWKKGLIEVESYIEKANLFCLPSVEVSKFKKGTSYLENVTLPWVIPNKTITTYLHKQAKGGVITYKINNNNIEPKPEIIVIPESSWNKIRNLLKEMLENLESAPQVVIDYINLHPEEITLLVYASLAIIGGGLILSAASGGASALATLSTAICAGIIIKECISYQEFNYGP